MVVDILNAIGNLCDEIKSTFQCSQCEQTFSKKQSLEKHVANEHEDSHIVSKEKKSGKFDCNYCDRSFRRERNLTLHIRDDHENDDNNEDEEDEDVSEETADDETVGFDVGVEFDPNLMTYKADDQGELLEESLVSYEMPLLEDQDNRELTESMAVDSDQDDKESLDQSSSSKKEEELMEQENVEGGDNHVNLESPDEGTDDDNNGMSNNEDQNSFDGNMVSVDNHADLEIEQDGVNTEISEEGGDDGNAKVSEFLGQPEQLVKSPLLESMPSADVEKATIEEVENQYDSSNEHEEKEQQDVINSLETNICGDEFSSNVEINGEELKCQDDGSIEEDAQDLINPSETENCGEEISRDVELETQDNIVEEEDVPEVNNFLEADNFDENVANDESHENRLNEVTTEEKASEDDSVSLDYREGSPENNSAGEQVMEVEGGNQSITEDDDIAVKEGIKVVSDEFLLNGESIVMDDIAFNILANTLEMTMETPEEEVNLPQEEEEAPEVEQKPSIEKIIINNKKRKSEDTLVDSLDPALKKIKEEPQDEIELSGEPVFSSTPAPLSVLKAELKKKDEVKKTTQNNRKSKSREYNYPNVAKKLICSYCKQIFPSRPDFNDHMAADHPDILAKHSNNAAIVNRNKKVVSDSKENVEIKSTSNKVVVTDPKIKSEIKPTIKKIVESQKSSEIKSTSKKMVVESKKSSEIKSISKSVKITHIPCPTKTDAVIKKEKVEVKDEEIIMNSIPKSTRIIFTPVSGDGKPLLKPASPVTPKFSTPNIGKGVKITQIGANETKLVAGKGVKITQVKSEDEKEPKLNKSVKITPATPSNVPVPTNSESLKTNPVKKLLCTYCKGMFLSRPEFNKHILEDHPDISQSNSKVDMKTNTKVASKAAKSAVFKCNSCQISFEEKQKYEQHLDDKHGHKCEHCNVSYRVKAKLEEHKRNAHSHKCTICNQKFVSSEKLAEHTESHKIKCEQCPEIFKSKMKMLDHKKSQHSHKCEKCNARFDEKSKLEIHMEKHLFKCDKCTEAFDSKIKIIEHKKAMHSFLCEKCKKMFDDKSSLEEHIKTNHMNKCKVCDSIFDFKNKLEEHVKKEHNFKCGQCEETFELEESAGEHEREKHSSCETCEDEFAWAESEHSCYYTKNNVRPTKERVQVQNLYFDYPASFI